MRTHTHTHHTHTHIKDIRSQAWLYTILSLLSPSQVERRTMHTQYTTKHSLSFPSDCSLHPLLPATLFIRAKMMTKLKCLEGKNISMFEHCSTKKNILKLYIIENCSTHTEEKKNLEGKKKKSLWISSTLYQPWHFHNKMSEIAQFHTWHLYGNIYAQNKQHIFSCTTNCKTALSHVRTGVHIQAMITTTNMFSNPPPPSQTDFCCFVFVLKINLVTTDSFAHYQDKTQRHLSKT